MDYHVLNTGDLFVIVITETGLVFHKLSSDETPFDVAKSLAGINLVEVVKFAGHPGFCGLISEEGKMDELGLNRVATNMYDCRPDYIAGPMVICSDDVDLTGLNFSDAGLRVRDFVKHALIEFFNENKPKQKPATSL